MNGDDPIYESKEYEYVLRKNLQLHLDIGSRERIAVIASLYKDRIKKIGYFVENDKLLIEVIKDYIRIYEKFTDDDYEVLNESSEEVLTTSELGMKYQCDYSDFEANLRIESDKKKGIHGGYQYNAFNDSYDDIEQEGLSEDILIL